MSSPHFTRVVLLTAILVSGAALLPRPDEPGDNSDREPAPPVNPPAATSTAPALARQLNGLQAGGTARDERDQTLAGYQHPAVQSWLQQEAEKIALRDWFANPASSEHTAEEAWGMIEQAEARGRVMAFEALHLKMAWLEQESETPDEFEHRATALLAQYREQAEQAAAAWSPEQVPGFSAYKARERQIIDEVNALEIIPGGLSRQAYLRELLLQARIDAYGQARTAAP